LLCNEKPIVLNDKTALQLTYKSEATATVQGDAAIPVNNVVDKKIIFGKEG
jgi:hypothetical protein